MSASNFKLHELLLEGGKKPQYHSPQSVDRLTTCSTKASGPSRIGTELLATSTDDAASVAKPAEKKKRSGQPRFKAKQAAIREARRIVAQDSLDAAKQDPHLMLADSVPLIDRKDSKDLKRLIAPQIFTQLMEQAKEAELDNRLPPPPRSPTPSELRRILRGPKHPVKGFESHLRRQALAVKRKIDQREWGIKVFFEQTPKNLDPAEELRQHWTKLVSQKWKEVDELLAEEPEKSYRKP
eukprot:Gregarina_sp_Poly_1__2083@NODE_154_length_12409_cov_137_944904_g136_i0_p9_GENE_NODE_154_length_12409_cov_137_944904_g136_i0NODE_154_length_12409_cov_137_944904_g136_i0_p9_ORF_typecomplete_len239_score45_04RPN13_C/PF16550_5/0_061_NODE_154_length_12409_cov_137_944904_g136_i0959810314